MMKAHPSQSYPLLSALLFFFFVTWSSSGSLLSIWLHLPFSFIILYAARLSIPSDLYEAAAIDGAGILSRFRHITYPQLLPLMVINFVGAFIAAFHSYTFTVYRPMRR